MGEQHVQYWRKALLRRHLLRWSVDGPAYVPFIGDGDLAVDMYSDRQVYGADIDPQRVSRASSRLVNNSEVRVADCDGWPFPDKQFETPFAVADFDAYSMPYHSFRSFWSVAPKADRMVLFFTDGERQTIVRVGSYVNPLGKKIELADLRAQRMAYGSYLNKIVWPWFDGVMEKDGYRILDRWRYLRLWNAYWGAVIER